MLRSTLVLALVAIACLPLACGSSTPTSTTSATANPTPTPTAASIGFQPGKYQRTITDLDSDNGIWTLQFDSAGNMTASAHGHDHPLTYSVNGDRITIRQPECPDEGSYTWTASGGMLTFKLAVDACTVGNRAKVLSDGPWTRV